jgi:hypothetical protein
MQILTYHFIPVTRVHTNVHDLLYPIGLNNYTEHTFLLFVSATIYRVSEKCTAKHTESEICALLGHYAASCGNCLPTFRDKVSVPSSQIKSPSRKESQQPKT